jgi:hypothetical protein
MPVVTGQNIIRQLSGALQGRKSALAIPLSARTADFQAHEHCTWLRGSAEEALTQRRSVRAFAAAGVSRSDVLGAIRAARDAEEAVWPPGKHGRMGLGMLVAAFNVDGLTRGLYSAREASTEPILLDSAYLNILREQYAEAPVLILICADVNQACRDAGEAGYPAALIRAGTVGYAAWLWSVSAGLAGCVYGATSQHASGVGRQWDENLRHLFTVAIGVPAGAVSPGADGGSESRP